MSRQSLISPSEQQADFRFFRRLFDSVEMLFNGRSRNQGSFTLTAGGTTTTVKHPLFESHQTLTWMPTTANAAGAMTNLYVSARTKGQFTLTHSNTATVDRTFEYIFVG